MATAKEILEGQRWGVEGTTALTYKGTRRFHVTEIDGDDVNKMETAINTALGKAGGGAHPINNGAIFQGANVVMGHSRDAYVELAFGTEQAEALTLGASLRQISTVTDKSGPIKVYYKKGNEGEAKPSETETKSQGVAVQVTAASQMIRIVRRVPKSHFQIAALQQKFFNRINSRPFVFATDPYRWRVVGLTETGRIRKSDNLQLLLSADFEYREEGHNPVAVYIDPATGRPPEDITMPGKTTLADGANKNLPKPGDRGNGTYLVNHYAQADFTELSKLLFSGSGLVQGQK